jgi:hypothetical protein
VTLRKYTLAMSFGYFFTKQQTIFWVSEVHLETRRKSLNVSTNSSCLLWLPAKAPPNEMVMLQKILLAFSILTLDKKSEKFVLLALDSPDHFAFNCIKIFIHNFPDDDYLLFL